MIEDDIYRTSSQYRYWSYTKENLARIRQNTNELASEKVRAAFRRAHRAKGQNRNNDEANGSAPPEVEVQTLTVDEELKIVEWGCSKITEMGEHFSPRIPTTVVVGVMAMLRRACSFRLTGRSRLLPYNISDVSI